nr:MAG TPA: hypothetical protein [Caudoviricetes sp.]
MLLFSMIFSTRLELSLLKLDIGLARFNGIAYIICFTFFVI